MSTDAFAKMAEYFESLVQEMKSEARQAGLLQNTTAVGTGRVTTEHNGGWDRQGYYRTQRRLGQAERKFSVAFWSGTCPITAKYFVGDTSSMLKVKRQDRLT